MRYSTYEIVNIIPVQGYAVHYIGLDDGELWWETLAAWAVVRDREGVCRIVGASLPEEYGRELQLHGVRYPDRGFWKYAKESEEVTEKEFARELEFLRGIEHDSLKDFVVEAVSSGVLEESLGDRILTDMPYPFQLKDEKVYSAYRVANLLAIQGIPTWGDSAENKIVRSLFYHFQEWQRSLETFTWHRQLLKEEEWRKKAEA